MPFTLALAILLCLAFVPRAHAQKPKAIEKQEISDWYNKKYSCPTDRPLYFYTFDEFDFQGTGTDQAIVVAMSCEGGTGGPDIHSVLSRDTDGELQELNIPDAPKPTYDNMFGNRNSDLGAEDGLLIATFTDDGDRETPLVIKYKWNGKEFAIVAIQKTGIFPTSYDCGAKTLTETENAICHVKDLAKLDVQLNGLYKSLLSKLTAADRAAFLEDQRKWLADRDKSCSIYKGWVSCLSDYCQKRIEDLKKRSAAIPPKDSPLPN